MSDFYLGNGTRKPRLEDYRREFGIDGQMIYTLDKIRYEQKRRQLKETIETNKKASKYIDSLGWEILQENKTKKKKRKNF